MNAGAPEKDDAYQWADFLPPGVDVPCGRIDEAEARSGPLGSLIQTANAAFRMLEERHGVATEDAVFEVSERKGSFLSKAGGPRKILHAIAKVRRVA